MDAKDLLHAMGEIDEKYIEEANSSLENAASNIENDPAPANIDELQKTPANVRKPRFRPWMVGGVAAAIFVGFVSFTMLTRLNQKPETAQMTEGFAMEADEAAKAEEAETAEEAEATEDSDTVVPTLEAPEVEVPETAVPDEAAKTEGAETAEDEALEAANSDAAAASSEEESEAAAEEPNAMIANPFSEFDKPEEAEKAAGFSFAVPDEAAGGKPSVYRVIRGELYEVIFRGNDGNEILRLRKGPGENDISGDYNDYSSTSAETIDGRVVTLRGEREDIYLATWVEDSYSYALMTELPLSVDEVREIVAEVK